MAFFKNHVHFSEPGTGKSHRFEPGDVCPRHLEKFIDKNNFESAAEEEAPQAVDYGRLNKTELESLCADRDLDFVGTKEELINRLKDSDAALA